MCLLDDAVEPDENQLEQIRSFDTVIRQTHEDLSGYKYLPGKIMMNPCNAQATLP